VNYRFIEKTEFFLLKLTLVIVRLCMLNREIRDSLKRDIPLLKNVYLKMWDKYTGTNHIIKTFKDRDWWIAIKNNVFNRLQNPVLKFPIIPGEASVGCS